MNERHTNLLCGLVDQYIKSAYPVSSRALAEALQLSLSPATIRHHLLYLDQAGFIIQPHVSAGRIPTDRGYRYYVNASPDSSLPRQQTTAIRRQYHEHLTSRPLWRARLTTQLLSQLSRAVAVTVWFNPAEIQQAGLSELLEDLAADGSELPVINEVAGFLYDLENFIPTVLGDLAVGETAIYIGHENPYYQSSAISVIASRTRDAKSDPVILMIVGPKRMPYQHHRAVIETLSTIISQP